MEEKKLHVIIAGQCNTGKSTLAEWLEFELDRNDIPSEVIDDSPANKAVSYDLRWEALTNVAHVTIETIQLARGADRYNPPHSPAYVRQERQGIAVALGMPPSANLEDILKRCRALASAEEMLSMKEEGESYGVEKRRASTEPE